MKKINYFLMGFVSLLFVFWRGEDIAFAEKFPCEVTRLTMGRTSNPEESLIFQIINITTYPDWSDPPKIHNKLFLKLNMARQIDLRRN